jgi:hypothetical protein
MENLKKDTYENLKQENIITALNRRNYNNKRIEILNEAINYYEEAFKKSCDERHDESNYYYKAANIKQKQLLHQLNEKKLFLKDSLLFSYIEKEQKYKEIIKIQNEKYGILNDNYINNNNLLKKEKVKNTINQILIGLSIFGFTYSIIFK